VSVNLATEKGVVVSKDPIALETVKQAVAKAGYEVTDERAPVDILKVRYQRSLRNMKVALAFTLPLMVLMILVMSGASVPFYHWLELAVGVVVLAWAGKDTLKGSWIAIRHLHTNMDTLVSLGAVTALITTVLALAGLKVLSFGAISPMLLTLHLIGRHIESRMRDRASRSIKSLLSMKVDTVMLTQGEVLLEVPVETVKPGHRILVRNGEKVPLDGEVVEGEGFVDESMISGEPDPISKRSGDTVTSGTVLTNGWLKVEVKRVGSDTFINQMIKLVEEAQSSKIPIQAMADRMTHYFIPVVFFMATVSALVWFFFYDSLQPLLVWAANLIPWITSDAGPLSTAIFVFVASIVIACPCALGLATPMALVSAGGAAAKKGLIIRNGEALSVSRNLDVLLMDKTGTITEGKPGVVDTDLKSGDLRAVAGIEIHSTHPIGDAIVRHVDELNLKKANPVSNIHETAGEGITGDVEGDRYVIGKPSDPTLYGPMLQKGYTVVEVTKNNAKIGYIAVADQIKPDSIDAIRQLKGLGIETVMVTGDQAQTAGKIARLVGIDTVLSGVKPKEKADIVREYQMNGHITGMVGDGINDAAAIKNADLGIAIGTGTDLAIESGDIVIIGGELSRVTDAIVISRLTHRTIRQNLFWAFAYNIVAIPLAMLGLLHPVIAEAAMTFSSINVILNSRRIAL
jgi:Cu+-exporting ATPase